MFLYQAIVFIGFLLIAYFIRIFRVHFYTLAENSLSLVDTLLLKINEDEKVKLVQRANNKLLLSLGKVFVSILIAITVGSVPFILYLFVKEQSFNDLDFSSTYSIISLSAGSTLAFLIPLRKASSSGYSELSQLLHRMALNNYAIAYKLFKLESKKIKSNGITRKGKFVIVSGLARSGTTSLMNQLTENKAFASLNYANMPFLTAPNFWNKFYKPKSSEKKERSHKDGILVGLDSNEALEEYFFKVLSNDAYIKDDSLLTYSISEEQYHDYIQYQSIVRNDNQKIYLAKNNNFALRYHSLRAHNNEFIIIFMFRDPLTHAASLLEKHKEFSSLQKSDSFILEYMNWLGHHEFGLNQKPFQFSNTNLNFKADKNSLDYWLQLWINYYSHLLTIDRSGVIYVDYDFYCQQPKALLDKIYTKIGIPKKSTDLLPYHNKRKVEFDCSEDLKKQAFEIFLNLKALT